MAQPDGIAGIREGRGSVSDRKLYLDLSAGEGAGPRADSNGEKTDELDLLGIGYAGLPPALLTEVKKELNGVR